MAIKLGIHTGPQDLTMEELLRLWKRADSGGFHWISVWDHFYANPLRDRGNPCFEGVAAMAALAAVTSNVRVGCLVFCALFRNPGLLAKAAVTIDHVSNGRAEIGIGAGWFKEEFEEFGYPFPPIGERLDQLEEALQVTRSLLHDPVTNYKGKYYDIQGAVCAPKPKNPKMRLWVGGRGEKRTPRIAARYGDGFNMPYLPPAAVKERLASLTESCARIGRDSSELETSVNVHFQMRASNAAANVAQHEPVPSHLAAGALLGSPQQAIDRIGEYLDAGVQGLNIAFRPPIDWDALEAYIEEVIPVFHR